MNGSGVIIKLNSVKLQVQLPAGTELGDIIVSFQHRVKLGNLARKGLTQFGIVVTVSRQWSEVGFINL